ncbi:MAG: type IV conjugative transfer system protein TraE, partial [Candidatus Thiodiazotropha endolucinida]|nr:type IV conjugative transfer system protein TraE [Candidatus Thiodiazotropha taylori]MCW4264868.1 type IV conjugative transfer system protein TraE [Candidatus Thiodiazotropha endolucinida]
MKLNQFLKTWEGVLIENTWNRITLSILSLGILSLTILLFNKEQLIVLQPATLNADAWITKNSSSQSYKEAWGLYFSILTANITPSNISFIKERIQPYLSPKIYTEVIDDFETQAQKITSDRITVRFEPRLVEYEEGTDKVFVYGYSFI